ncbi:MAG: phytoene desaturase family protein [Thermoanaerobaculia bacterium]|nr:phytoene desaturase family protein [Thermoanaerobaculia bacterium]
MSVLQMSSRKPRRAVVVGAGPGGLASAMLLARAGVDVTVLERHDRVGGRTSTIEQDGFRFDLGPTFFLYPQVLRSIFQMCGRSLDEEVELIRLDPNYRLRFEDGAELLASTDLGQLERQVASISPDDAANVRRYIEDNRKKLDAFTPILQSSFSGVRDLFKVPLGKILPLLRPFSSVDSDLGRYFTDPRIRLAFSFQSKYLGMSPFQCPSLFTILAFLELEHGVFHPRGGCGAVTEAMARVAGELGADVRLGEPVEEILFDGRRAVGVRTPRGSYRCDALVVNADFAEAMRRLVPDGLRRRWTDRKLARKRYSCSTFMLYLGLDGEEPDLDHHTIFLTDDYRENLDDIETRHRLSENPSFYVHNPCVTDPTMAPPGMTSLYMLVPVTHEHPNVDWSREEERFRSVALRQLERVGVTDVEKRIRFEKRLTPAGWSQEHRIYRGATFNLAHSLDQMLHLRPRNRFEDLDSVYLVGGGTHPGSGLPVIFESARITSRLLVDDLAIDAAWETAAEEALPERGLRTAAGQVA